MKPFRLLFRGLRFLFRWFRSGKRLNKDGYVVIRSTSGHEFTEHRKIAEEILGRRLLRWEDVHHINGKRHDNRPDNLCVMHHSDHMRYHGWYDWIVKTYGKHPRRVTQLRKLREAFNGTILSDVQRSGRAS